MQEKSLIDPVPLPFLTAEVPPLPGRIREHLEDFRVEEIPAYPPSGQGEHLLVCFEKRDLTTPEAVKRLGRALGVRQRDAGWAGLKDRRAVTVQWASFPGVTPEQARRAEVEGIRVLEAAAHDRKLRTGHLRGNRFTLRLRGVPAERAVDARLVLDRLGRTGLPNYFGAQRFGRDGRNVERARAWLVEGGRAPRDRFERKLLVSSLQSSLFNVVLAERVRQAELDRPLEGDLMLPERGGALWVVDDPDAAAEALERWDASPSGPMFGLRMRWPEGEAARRERAVLEAAGLDDEALGRFGRIGRGTRRPLRVPLRGALVEVEQGETLRLSFELPKGAYATVVLRELLKREPEAADSRANAEQSR